MFLMNFIRDSAVFLYQTDETSHLSYQDTYAQFRALCVLYLFLYIVFVGYRHNTRCCRRFWISRSFCLPELSFRTTRIIKHFVRFTTECITKPPFIASYKVLTSIWRSTHIISVSSKNDMFYPRFTIPLTIFTEFFSHLSNYPIPGE